ncbi:hypothetical protein FDP41_001206 [Naegleria fowleri]|uniref:Uncharacterized protein n=1 Tax=Naegleria fowleri TaxID=5763 RepID=A0A6A5BPU0_NAEFO|nr:uncharacterized protein FDP41_001206 [Naegleria fowleri]KAF0980053.1 hypothetical protein FDP41_001206 [Naegleria fowleri]CAG4715654.1 unnamed protein product [Naegleria fowleri]
MLQFSADIVDAVPKKACYRLNDPHDDLGKYLKRNLDLESNNTIFSNSEDVCFCKSQEERYEKKQKRKNNQKKNQSSHQQTNKKNQSSTRLDDIVMNVYDIGKQQQDEKTDHEQTNETSNSSTNYSNGFGPVSPVVPKKNNDENIYYELGGFQFKLEKEEHEQRNSHNIPSISIRHVAVSEKHCIVMIDANYLQDSAPHCELNDFPFRLYAFGDNYWGQLSFDFNKSGNYIYPGKEMEPAYSYLKEFFSKMEDQIPNFTTVTLRDVVCAQNFSLFLTSCGKLFSCGNVQMKNRYHSYHKIVPLEGTEKLRVEKISCGSNHILMVASPIIDPIQSGMSKLHIDDSGATNIVYGKRKAYGYGRSSNYELARFEQLVNTVVEIPVLSSSSTDEIVDVKAGGTFSLFFTKRGFIYSCGDNSYQQQGKEPHYVTIMDVMKLTSKEFDYNQFAIRNICCGDAFSVIVTHHGKVFTTIKTSRPTINVDQKKGFYEMEYFTKNNIHVENAFATKNAIIYQTTHGALYYSKVSEHSNGYSSIRKPILGKPRPINLSKFNASMKKVFSSLQSDHFLVMTLMTIELTTFFDLLLNSHVNHTNFSDIKCVTLRR